MQIVKKLYVETDLDTQIDLSKWFKMVFPDLQQVQWAIAKRVKRSADRLDEGSSVPGRSRAKRIESFVA